MELNQPITEITSRFAIHTASVVINATYISHQWDIDATLDPFYFSGSESVERMWRATFTKKVVLFRYAHPVCVLEGKAELQVDSSAPSSHVCRAGGYKRSQPILQISPPHYPGQNCRISFTVKYFRTGVDEVRQTQHFDPGSDRRFHVDYEDLLSSGKYADLSFVVEDQVIPAHKAILAARVPYFDNMSSGMVEAQTGCVKLDNLINVQAFKQVLKYIYGGQLPETLDKDAIQILPLADQYDLAHLKDACFFHMQKGLTKENICETLILADLHRGTNLKKECLQQLQQWGSAVESKVLEKLSEHPRLMIEVIRSK